MQSNISAVVDTYDSIVNWLSANLGGVVSLLIRLILGPVLIAAGWEKITGSNWLSQEMLPFPFSILPVELSWFLASWTEFLGGICLLLGLGTRLWAIPLAVTMWVMKRGCSQSRVTSSSPINPSTTQRHSSPTCSTRERLSAGS